MDFIFDAIGALFSFIGEIIATIIDGAISFFNHIVGWFKGLKLKKGRDVPFIADANKEKFKELIHKAPTKNVGIFEGVYNEDTEEITEYRYLDAEEIDDATRDTLDGEDVVVLN